MQTSEIITSIRMLHPLLIALDLRYSGYAIGYIYLTSQTSTDLDNKQNNKDRPRNQY
jgi:hypothetical protein